MTFALHSNFNPLSLWKMNTIFKADTQKRYIAERKSTSKIVRFAKMTVIADTNTLFPFHKFYKKRITKKKNSKKCSGVPVPFYRVFCKC